MVLFLVFIDIVVLTTYTVYEKVTDTSQVVLSPNKEKLEKITGVCMYVCMYVCTLYSICVGMYLDVVIHFQHRDFYVYFMFYMALME